MIIYGLDYILVDGEVNGYNICIIKTFTKTRTCGLVVINLKAKIRYGEATRVRVPATGGLTFWDRQEQKTDT